MTTTLKQRLTLGCMLGAIVLPAAARAQDSHSPNAPPPTPPSPVAAQPPAAAHDMQAVLHKLQVLGAKPVEALTPAQARMGPSPAEAAKAVTAAEGQSTAPTKDMPYGSDPKEFVRIYKPAMAVSGPMPVIVYYHGGGWVVADVDTYDATPRMLAKQLNAIVVSVEYSHAPEFKFPAQREDAAAAYKWVLANASA